MKTQSKARVITFSDLWTVFVHKIVIIVLVAVLVVGTAFAYNTITYVPKYKSTATLYILRQNQKQSDYEVKEDFSLALNVVNDCTYLLKSHAVLDQVIDNLNLSISYGDLANSVSTNNPDNTRVLEVSVVSDSPEQAKRIVDAVCEIGSKKIESAMGFNQVNLYEQGTLVAAPCNKTGLSIYLVMAIIVAAAVYLIFLIAYIADDRIRTEEDVENYLGLSVLGDIPNAYDNNKNRYGYYYGKSLTYENTKQSSKKVEDIYAGN